VRPVVRAVRHWVQGVGGNLSMAACGYPFILKRMGELIPSARLGMSLGYGSTETTFYILAVYSGSVAIRNTRYTLAASLLGDAAGIVAAFAACRLLF